MSHPVHLILSPGTRIVTRNDANRIGGGQFIENNDTQEAYWELQKFLVMALKANRPLAEELLAARQRFPEVLAGFSLGEIVACP